MQKVLFFICFLSLTIFSSAQKDTTQNIPSVFEKMMTELKTFVPDTSNVPDDKFTREIKKLRHPEGSFTINEVVVYKIQDDKNKKEISAQTANTLLQQFTNGDGKRWLTNAIMWVYRKHFTYKEMKQLVKFSGTSAGKKMAAEFPIIILQSVTALQGIYDKIAKATKK
ncbi:MAG: DUF2059 domain-containing protein [Chitinophagales bacterium]